VNDTDKFIIREEVEASKLVPTLLELVAELLLDDVLILFNLIDLVTFFGLVILFH
jgi:hypothetical protein